MKLMSYYPNSTQLHDDALLTGLMFVTGSIIGGVILYFLKPENDCSLPSEALSSGIEPTPTVEIIGEPLQTSSYESPVVVISDIPSIEPQTDQIETVDNLTS